MDIFSTKGSIKPSPLLYTMTFHAYKTNVISKQGSSLKLVETVAFVNLLYMYVASSP